MNWKTILHLIRVDVKSGRMMRGQRLQHYNVGRSRFSGYMSYMIAAIIGGVIGALVAWFYLSIASDATIQAVFIYGFANFQVALPLIILIVTLVFTMMQQIQRSGANVTRQAPYWLPVTWQEHTLASIAADVLGIPGISLAGIAPAILIVAAFTGQLVLAIGAVLAMFVSSFMAGALAEVARVLQVRFTGAVYKSTGKAAIWLRFAGSLLTILIFYIVYFYIIYGTGIVSIVTAVASAQNAVWYIPFVWPGMTLYSFIVGQLLQGFAFLALTLAFSVGMFYFATWLNTKMGLYEPPAITVSQGVYAPKVGMLGRLGFSSVEAAILRKDFKAFIRRRELISAFIPVIVFVLIPIMSGLNAGPNSGGFPPQLGYAFTTILPVGVLAMTLGNFMTGEEGQSIWRIYISPVSAKAFVKSKLSFMLMFAFAVLPITAVIGYFIYNPSNAALVSLVAEAVFMIFALGTLSLSNGIRGADFTEVPRPRMIRVDWSFINMGACAVAGLGILAPVLPYTLFALSGHHGTPLIGIYEGTLISAIIAIPLTVAFYFMAVRNAETLIAKAEL
jgi:hypothetical protein